MFKNLRPPPTGVCLFLGSVLLFAAGCKKETTEPTVQKEVDATKIYRVPITAAEKQLVGNLEKVTSVLKELYKSTDNWKVVNAAIYSKAYTDQTILLKDLIYPTENRLDTLTKFKEYSKKWNVNLKSFTDNFWAVVRRQGDSSFELFLQSLHGNQLTSTNRNTSANSTNSAEGDQVGIYYPYAEEFVPADDPGGGYYAPITTITTATADADQGWGNQPYYVNGALQGYVQVLVNDDYAFENPTQIVGINGVEPYDVNADPNTAFDPDPPIDLPNLPREVKQVYVGDVRCKKQYDAFISFTGNGGGSEIRFTRSDAFLKVNDGQVTPDQYITGDKTISRGDIRNKRFVDYSTEWDSDWELANLQQNLAIYEEDNRNTSTFNASLTTTLTRPPVTGGTIGQTYAGTIGFTITYKSDDYIIKQTNYNRDVFFVLNRTNLEGEMYHNWPVRDKGADVSFTLNDRTYY